VTKSIMYHEGNRRLQDAFDSRRISDRLEEKLTRTELSPALPRHRRCVRTAGLLLQRRDAGLRARDRTCRARLPGLRRNGMFKSLGNVLVNPNVGLLFIAMHGKPRRLRVNGTRNRQPRRSAARGNRRCAADRARCRASDLPQLPALHSKDGADQALDLCAPGRLRCAGARLEGRF
jgi:hypothetical protein